METKDISRIVKSWQPALQNLDVRPENTKFVALYVDHVKKTRDEGDIPNAVLALNTALYTFRELEPYIGNDSIGDSVYSHQVERTVYNQLNEVDQERYLDDQCTIAVARALVHSVKEKVKAFRDRTGLYPKFLLVNDACASVKRITEKDFPFTFYVRCKVDVA